MPRRLTVFVLLLSLVAPSFAGTCGDVDCDSDVDIIDSLLIAQASAGLIIQTPAEAAVSDVDGTGTVNILDALRLAQFAAGLPVTLNCPP